MGILDTIKKAISGSDSQGSGPVPSNTEEVLLPSSASSVGAERLPPYFRRVNRINALEDAIEKLDDAAMKSRIATLRHQVSSSQATMDSVLEEVFAIVREATFRVLGLRHYDVQLVGGMVLHDGSIAEMVTGEGKTIVAALPSCLNALTGDAVYVVTVNDYLAKRDADLIGQIHRYLGLSVGLIQSGMSPKDRRKAYACDITYVTNSELGFDYLRDNLAMSSAEVVSSRPLGFCIVDEADSILIDEARTPLIIAGRVPTATTKYATAQKAAEALSRDVHYTVNEKEQAVLLTERGYSDLERALNVSDLFDPKNPWASFITNSLKAKEVFKKDINYIVASDIQETDKSEIQIIDEFTGRALKGRRWSDGLHQAIEAKEGITVDTKELLDVYELPVVSVPTALPLGRKDYPDVVFKNSKGKYLAIMREIARVAPSGRPILIGTTSVEASETLSSLLSEVEVDHDVLNAKPESALRESEIVAQAGRKFSITIATNMAGRGTDILLGGNADYFARALARRELVSQNESLFKILSDPTQPVLIDDDVLPVDISEEAMTKMRRCATVVAENVGVAALSSLLFVDEIVGVAAEAGLIPEHMKGVDRLRESMRGIREELEETVAEEKEEVLELGGLYVIGTERAESRRVDNQLRGRAGRQGDPGSSRFFLALDDRLFRVFGGDKVTGILDTFRVGEETPIENSLVNKTLDSAQENVEAYFREIREQLFTYDEVLSKQRSAFYAQRRKIVLGDAAFIAERLKFDSEKTVREILPNFVNRGDGTGNDYVRLSSKLVQFFDGMSNISKAELENVKDIDEYVLRQLAVLMETRRDELESRKASFSTEVCRFLWLTQMDNLWMEHMKQMDYLKEFIVLRSYASDDPLQAYQIEGFEMFTAMQDAIRRNSVYSYFQYKADNDQTQSCIGYCNLTIRWSRHECSVCCLIAHSTV
ncbi:unnamed protein product [Chondrus crispus]|uniref:Uncharacterized protein n=1 Tax=Chondrus crispus TaxID=2769 RepID=R7QFF9_CHOCR|nr:unnamed protein product [Chondrus crispus]CDF37267.1 unnamed protein product [Chondrus crispus]|eukprot:XP_005717086.1 unnamed protein product [Chondrus crispus]